VIDWDLSCAFDPAWDVGHYVAQARRYQLKHGVATEDARAAFVAAYADAAGATDAFLRRVDYYEAIVGLHKAHAIGRAGAPIERSAALVEAAARALTRARG
jgi:aminoglycoside phosphotransferase (APT) family kinase protein